MRSSSLAFLLLCQMAGCAGGRHAVRVGTCVEFQAACDDRPPGGTIFSSPDDIGAARSVLAAFLSDEIALCGVTGEQARSHVLVADAAIRPPGHTFSDSNGESSRWIEFSLMRGPRTTPEGRLVPFFCARNERDGDVTRTTSVEYILVVAEDAVSLVELPVPEHSD